MLLSPALLLTGCLLSLVAPAGAATPVTEIFVDIVVRGRSLSVLVDTGATHTVFSAAAVALTGLTLSRENTTLTSFAGRNVKTRGTIAARVEFGGQNIVLPTVPVLPRLVHGDQVIRGMDYLSASAFLIHCSTERVTRDGLHIAAATTAIPAPEGTPDCLRLFRAVFAEPTTSRLCAPG